MQTPQRFVSLVFSLVVVGTASTARASNIADVTVTKTAPTTVVAGAAATYQVTVFNNGPDAAQLPSMDDPLLQGSRFRSLTQTSPDFLCHIPTVGDTGVVTCDATTFAAGAVASFTIVVRTDPALPAGSTLINRAFFLPQGSDDSNPANNTVTTTALVTTQADLSIAKTGPTQASAGGFVSYSIAVSNNGPSDAQTVSFTDNLPPLTRFQSLTQTSGPLFSCNAPPVNTNGVVSCSIGTLANLATATFTLTTSIDGGASIGTSISNSTSISTSTPDPAPANNSASALVAITAQIPLLSRAMLSLLAVSLAVAAWVSLKY